MIIPELVDGCQLRCALCWNRKRKPSNKQMQMPVVEKILEKYGNYYRIEWFNWGEPLLHQNFPEIAKLIRNTKSRISSNFSLPISDEYLQSLNNFKVVYVSISGMSPEIYQIYHKGGDYHLVMRNLRRFVDVSKTDLVLRWLKHKHNQHQLDQCRRFCDDNGIKFEPLTLNCEIEDLVGGFEHELYDKNKPSQTTKACKIINWIPIGVDGKYYLCCASHNVETGYTVFDDITIKELVEVKSKIPLCVQCQQCELWKML